MESGKAAGGKSRGKALFQRMAEREKEEGEEEEERLAPVELLPGVDMEEMRMHVMMRQPAELLPGQFSIPNVCWKKSDSKLPKPVVMICY